MPGTTGPVAASTSGSSNAARQASGQTSTNVQESSVNTTTAPRAASSPSRRNRGTHVAGGASIPRLPAGILKPDATTITSNRGSSVMDTRLSSVRATAVGEWLAAMTMLNNG
jgi:hypothetical protein